MSDAVPATMTAIEIKEPGGPEVLVPVERPVPQPGTGDLLLKIEAAGVNRPDVMQRQGNYNPPPGTTDIPGLEVAGTVVAAGPSTEGRQVGDRLCALVAGGGYAEYCLVPAPQALPIPKGFDMIQAAALPETFFTVWTNVFDRGRLQAGETFLVHGGSSGIGTVAIQLAKAFGARVVTTAGSEEKCQVCRHLGADLAVNYREDDFVEKARAFTDGKGVNLILDMVGGDYLPRDIDCLAPDGRLVMIAFQRGPKAELNFAKVMVNRLTITGSTLRPRSVIEKGGIAADLERNVWPKLEAREIKPIIHTTFPLAQAAEAHALMESSAHIGKIMLVV